MAILHSVQLKKRQNIHIVHGKYSIEFQNFTMNFTMCQ